MQRVYESNKDGSHCARCSPFRIATTACRLFHSGPNGYDKDGYTYGKYGSENTCSRKTGKTAKRQEEILLLLLLLDYHNRR